MHLPFAEPGATKVGESFDLHCAISTDLPVGRMHRSLTVHCASDAISGLSDTNVLGYAKSKSVTSWPRQAAFAHSCYH